MRFYQGHAGVGVDDIRRSKVLDSVVSDRLDPSVNLAKCFFRLSGEVQHFYILAEDVFHARSNRLAIIKVDPVGDVKVVLDQSGHSHQLPGEFHKLVRLDGSNLGRNKETTSAIESYSISSVTKRL